MEERRLLLAVALSLLVLTGYRMLYPPPPVRQTTAESMPEARGEAVVRPDVAGEAHPEPERREAQVAAPAAAMGEVPARARPETISDEFERRVEVVGAVVRLAFSNRGAELLSWKLADYQDERGSPEEMVQRRPEGPRPLSVQTGNPAVDARLQEALFKPSAEVVELDGAGEGAISFTYADEDLEATKELKWSRQGYLAEVNVRVLQDGQPLAAKVFWGPGVGQPEEGAGFQGFHQPQAVVFTTDGVERYEPSKLEDARRFSSVRWGGVESQFFAALWIPADGAVEVGRAFLPAVPGEEAKHGPTATVEIGSTPALLYVGPKDHAMLARFGFGLERVVAVGDWIGPIVVPLLQLLRWVHGFAGNYGWSIVVLTVLINLIMAPLRHYSIANSVKMSKLAPEMKVIQERYRKVPALDPRRQEMQKEIAALYARHGMNMGTQMLVGCLPLLLTMPFLFAFYRVLQVSIDLRGAAFLWIPDLSQKDPLFITPVLMGVSMLVMQRMMPTTMDPAQQRIMLIMPVVLVVMLFAAPGGLNLYWLASNVCSIVQQGVTLKLLRTKDPKRPKGKARRR